MYALSSDVRPRCGRPPSRPTTSGRCSAGSTSATSCSTFVELYRRIKTERGVMDFSDQMAGAARLAEARPEVGEVERQRFSLVLLDEYQDTSVAQARLLRALFSDSVDVAGRGHPVTAVGDPCQAIYGWRGASVGNIEQFPSQFRPLYGDDDPGRAAARYPLSVNRRSRRRILQTANVVAASLFDVVHRGRAARGGAGAGGGTGPARCRRDLPGRAGLPRCRGSPCPGDHGSIVVGDRSAGPRQQEHRRDP